MISPERSGQSAGATRYVDRSTPRSSSKTAVCSRQSAPGRTRNHSDLFGLRLGIVLITFRTPRPSE